MGRALTPRPVRDLRGQVVRTRVARRAQAREKRWRDTPFGEVLEHIRVRSELPDAEDEPLFVFSAGWRSGSTLLQRLLMSTNSYYIWGEPYARCDLIRRLADSLRPISPGWPPEEYLVNGQSDDAWIANLYPSLERLVESHRALFRQLFASQQHWGLKEVRLGVEYAQYLAFLFPRARFVFLVRDPEQAFASYKRWRSWYRTWPDQQVRTPRAFGNMWRELASGFLAPPEALRAFLIRYEDLAPQSPVLPRLEDFLRARVDDTVLSRRIVGSATERPRLGAAERFVLRRSVGDVPRAFGYG